MRANGQSNAVRVVTFGEIMLRLSPPGRRRFVQAEDFRATFGGAEANVAVSLARFGLESQFVTKLPPHDVGEAVRNYLRRYGVRTDHVVRGGNRLGIYFLEAGAGLRGSKVIYDRADAAITTLEPGEVDWDAVFQGTQWFHWTGITPALGPQPRQALEAALEAAARHGVTVSCDLNYRSKLWSRAEAQAVLRPLMDGVDVLVAGRTDARNVLGLEEVEIDAEDDVAAAKEAAVALREALDLQAVAVTLRDALTASHHNYSAVFCNADDCATPIHSQRYEITSIVDRVGGGDAFAAGLIYGMTTRRSSRAALEFAVAAGCIKHTIEGDANLATPDEVEQLAAGAHSVRTKR